MTLGVTSWQVERRKADRSSKRHVARRSAVYVYNAVLDLWTGCGVLRLTANGGPTNAQIQRPTRK